MASFLDLTIDSLHLVVQASDLDTLIALTATSHQLSSLVPTVLRSHLWRSRPENERALQLALWRHGENDEACLGAFAAGDVIYGLHMQCGHVACFGSGGIRLWDVSQPEAQLTHSLSVGEVHSVAIGRDLLAAVICPSWTPDPLVRVFHVGSDSCPSTAAATVGSDVSHDPNLALYAGEAGSSDHPEDPEDPEAEAGGVFCPEQVTWSGEILLALGRLRGAHRLLAPTGRSIPTGRMPRSAPIPSYSPFLQADRHNSPDPIQFHPIPLTRILPQTHAKSNQ